MQIKVNIYTPQYFYDKILRGINVSTLTKNAPKQTVSGRFLLESRI
jgi:hypothetical protein